MIALLFVTQILALSLFTNKLTGVLNQSLSIYLTKTPNPTCPKDLYLYLANEHEQTCPAPRSDIWPHQQTKQPLAQSICIFTNIIQKSYAINVFTNNKTKTVLCKYQ